MTDLSSVDSRLIGELSANMQNVMTKIDQMDDKLDSALITCREFELCKKAHTDYQLARVDVPDRIMKLEGIAADYLKIKPQIEKACAQNDYLKMLLGVLWLVVVALIGLIQQGYLRVQI